MALTVLLAAAMLWFAGAAHAYVYWTSTDGVGRAELDGSHVDQGYIAGLGGSGYDASVALDSGSIYWGESTLGPGPVWIATLDGTDIEQLPLDASLGKVAVDGDQLFFSEWGGGIGRLDLTTGDVQLDVIGPEYGALTGPVVYDGRLYWADESHNRIGSADLDGSHMSFIPTCQPGAIAVAAGHVYWSDWCAYNAIHRSDLDGKNLVYDFLPIAGGDVEWIAVDDAHVYWVVWDKGYIGRADLDGGHPDMGFITGIDVPTSVAVDSLVGSLSSIDLAASKSSSYYGDPPTFTATVATGGDPAGTVQFQVDGFDDGDALPVDGSHHALYVPTGPIDVGSRVTARYNGDRRSSSAGVDMFPTILPARTALSVGSSKDSKGLWHFSATVANSDTKAVPFGSVAFYIDGRAIGTADVDADGRASLAGAYSQATAATLRAHYHDDTAGVPDFVDSEATTAIPATPVSKPPLTNRPPVPSTKRPGVRPIPQTFWFAGVAIPHRDGSVTVPVATNQAGVMRAVATTSASLSVHRPRGASQSLYGTGSLTATGAGRFQLLVRPNSRARRALSHGGRFSLRISVGFRPAAGGAAPASKLIKAVVTRR